MKIRFYLKDPKAPIKTAIFASISFDTQRMKYYLPESIEPSQWNGKKQEAKTKYYDTALNTRLLGHKGAITKSFNALADNDNLSISTLKMQLDVIYERAKAIKTDFYSFATDFIAKTELGQRLSSKGTKINPKSAYGLKQMIEKLKSFEVDWRKAIDWKNFDIDFYDDFTNYLNDQGESLNTVGKRIKDLKTILNAAFDKNINPLNTYQKWKVSKEAAYNISLTQDELTAIENLDLSKLSKGLQETRDLFVICCHTGLRHSDAGRLNEYFTIKDGFLYGDQQKTGGAVVLPLHDSVKRIISKYGGKFPQASANQVENRNLKEIADMVESLRSNIESKAQTKGGLKTYKRQSRAEMVCTHTGRRSFATLSYKSGLPTVSIMAMTGHKTEKSFLGYLKISQSEHAAIVAKAWSKENNLKAI